MLHTANRRAGSRLPDNGLLLSGLDAAGDIEMTRKVTIQIIDEPKEAAAIALAMRKYILNNTAAFVFDNCAVGSAERPRRLTAEFYPEKWEDEKSLIQSPQYPGFCTPSVLI